MAEIICGIYRIINTVTGYCYIGSSKNIKERWASHKCPSRWKRYSNNPMYLDMKKYRNGYRNKYDNQQCYYNGQTLTLSALRNRFMRQGIPHSALEAKKYLVL